MGLINPKPRFGYDDATDLVYDYLRGRDIALTDDYSAVDGVWDLHEVKRLILAGVPIETARVGESSEANARTLIPPPPVQQPGTVDAPSSSGKAKASNGLSADDLKALGLSPLQQAALGLTRSQIDVVGIEQSTIEGWGITAARADALKLNPEQRAALLVA